MTYFYSKELTRSALPDLFRRNRQDAEHLDQDGRDCIRHFLIWWHLGVDFETSKKGFYSFEDVDESVLARTDIFNCLRRRKKKLASKWARAMVLRRTQTERRTPIPTNIAFAGENTCQMPLKNTILIDLCPGAHQANAFSERFREGVEDIYRRVQPLGQPFIAILRSIKLFGLLLKHQENAAGSVAGLELCSERVGKKIRFSASLICFQGIIENLLKARGRCGGCGSRVRMRLRHNSWERG